MREKKSNREKREEEKDIYLCIYVPKKNGHVSIKEEEEIRSLKCLRERIPAALVQCTCCLRICGSFITIKRAAANKRMSTV